MGVREIADQLRPKVEGSGFDRSVKFDTGADGVILANDPVLPGDRAEIRDRSTTVALQLVRRALLGGSAD